MAKSNKSIADRCLESKYKAEILAELIENLTHKQEYICEKWEVVGKKDTQSKDWRTGELLWEDDEKTIPKMEDKYDSVTHTFDELTHEEQIKYNLCNSLMEELANLL